jgi:tetratricopeptide (TPR) repeat protein
VLTSHDRDRFCQAAAGELTGRVAAARVPAQLPSDVAAFTGREEELAQLDALLAGGDDPPTAVVISAIAGTAGVGKTALAVRWAHRVRGRFPDGQLYVNLRAYDPEQPADPADVLTSFLSAVGVTGQDIPHDLDDRAARYRSEVADRRILIVLDNAGSAEQVRPLLPGSSSSTVVVTSRNSLAGLVAVHGAHRLELDLLPAAEAVTLLRRLVGARVDAQPEAAAMLVERCARLPLALRVAAELAVSRPSVPLADLVAELGDQRRRLDLLDSGDPYAAVRTVFSWSIQHLSPDAAAMFRLLSLHPGLDVDPYAVAAVAGISLDDARRTVEVLVRAHLLQPTGPGRYGMHDLLHAYAAELARTHDTQHIRHAAQGRLLDHYRHAASVAMDIVYPFERERRPRVPPAGTPTPDLSDPAVALAWLDTELPNLLAAARSATEHSRPVHLLHLSTILHRHLRTRARYHDASALHQQALTAACAAGDQAGQLNALVGLGDIHQRQGRHAQATDHYQQALQIADATGHHPSKVAALVGLGDIHLAQGRRAQATDHYQQALQIARVTGDRPGELHALNGLGSIHRLQGRYAQATDHYRQALQIARVTGDRPAELNALVGLGHVYQAQGQYARAADHYRRALQGARATGHRPAELIALNGLGHSHRRRGRYARAADHYRQAQQVARATGNHEAELNALTGLGWIHRLQGRYASAADHHQQLLDLAQASGERNYEFEAWQGLGRLQYATGDADAALAHHERALVIAGELNQPDDQARAHDGLAYAHHALHQPEHARTHWQHALAILTKLGIDVTEDEETNTATIRTHLRP